MFMPACCAAPSVGHLNRLKKICAYLMKMKDFKIQFRTHEPDFSDLESIPQDWTSLYRDVEELLPHAAPSLLGKPVQLPHYVDANLFHDALTGQSVTACLNFVNGIPIE